MAHDIQTTDGIALTSEEQQKLAKLLTHPDIQVLIKELEKKDENTK